MPRLPTELWSQVFIFSVQDNLGTLPALQAVNSTFYFITNGTPELWTRLILEPDIEYDLYQLEPRGVFHIPHIQALLRRSRTLPLDIRIRTRSTVAVVALATLLRKEVPRLQSLTLDLDVSFPPTARNMLTMMGAHNPAPLLERLQIFCDSTSAISTSYYSNPGELFVADIFRPSPRLTHVSLPASSLPASSTEFIDLFSAAKSIVIDGNFQFVDKRRVIEFLSKIPFLESFAFKGDGYGDILFSHFGLLHLSTPHLRSADVTVPGDGLDILRCLNAPFLVDARLQGRAQEGNDAMGPALLRLLDDLSLNSPLIERLELVSTRMFDPLTDYAWLFKGIAFPSLRCLRLESTDITDDALWISVPCEKLKRLELCACTAVTGRGLAKFAERCSEDFELLLDSCQYITLEDIATLSKTVKVEFR